MSDKIIRWGIIGVGDVTEKKSGPAFSKIPGSKLVAVNRRNFEKAQDYAHRHNIQYAFQSADELINHPDVDAVYIATPPDSHAEYTIRVAEAGKPIYVEKPMARTGQECDWMNAAASRAGVPLWVAYYRRRLPNFVQAKEWIEAGEIGKVRFVSLRLFAPIAHEFRGAKHLPWRVIPEQAGGGLFFDLAPHQLDIIDFMLGPISHVSGRAGNQAKLYPAEDIVLAHWQHASGAMGTGSWCFTVDENSNHDQIEIFGESGKISLACFGDKSAILENGNGKMVKEFEYPENIQFNFIQTIVDELHGKGTCPSTGISAARTAKVMDAIVADYRKEIGFKI